MLLNQKYGWLHHKENEITRVEDLSRADRYFSLPGYNAIYSGKQVPTLQTSILSPSSGEMSDSSPLK
jgi:hypothetical protein